MNMSALSDSETERLRGAPFTYREVAATLGGELPSGYRTVRRVRELGLGSERFERAAQALLSWEMHRRAGVHVRASTGRVLPETVAVLRLGFGLLSVRAPVRVVRVVDEPRRQGFAYGTLPSHPERGEEAFVVEMDDNGAVTFTITAFSRPATLLGRAGGPLSRAVQTWVTNRYLSSI